MLLEVAGSDDIFTETALALRTTLMMTIRTELVGRSIKSHTSMVLLALQVPQRLCPARQLKTGLFFLNFSKQTLTITNKPLEGIS